LNSAVVDNKAKEDIIAPANGTPIPADET